MRQSVCAAIRWLLPVLFIAAVIAAIAAGGIGLDSDQKWGPFRRGLLAAGLLGLGLPLAARLIRSLDVRLIQRRRSRSRSLRRLLDEGSSEGMRAVRPGTSTPSADRSSRNSGAGPPGPAPSGLQGWSRPSRLEATQSGVAVALFLVGVWGLYLWFVSFGQFTKWPATTNYYALLADAFLDGRTDLRVASAPDISDIEDPYHHVNLGLDFSYVTDFAYFQGSYYLYFGPVPAALIAPVMAISHQDIGDQVVTFGGMVVASFFLALILLHVKTSYFRELPLWLLASAVVVAGAAHPMLWMLSWGAIYSAAISWGQALFLGGLFFALPILAGYEIRMWRLGLAGLLWAGALGSRLSLAGAVVGLALVMLWRVAGAERRLRRRSVAPAALLLAPLVLMIVVLGLYNDVRFGSPFETGVRYTLNLGDPYYLVQEGRLFNLSYLAPNVLYYLATPVNKTPAFPFIRPVRQSPASFSMFLGRLDFPETYSVERITGLLVAAPYILFAVVALVQVLCGEASRPSRVDVEFQRLVQAMSLAGLLAAAPLFLYYLVNSRFLMDFSPTLVVLAAVGTWIAYRRSVQFPIQRGVIIAIIVLAAAMTLAASFLLAMTGPATLFDDYNPGVWQWLRSLGSW